jgi:hypothetical protein
VRSRRTLVQVPAIARPRTTLAQPLRDRGAEFLVPSAASFHTRCRASFDQEFLDVLITQGEAEIQPDGVLDELGREVMAAVAERSHADILSDTPWLPTRFSLQCAPRRTRSRPANASSPDFPPRPSRRGICSQGVAPEQNHRILPGSGVVFVTPLWRAVPQLQLRHFRNTRTQAPEPTAKSARGEGYHRDDHGGVGDAGRAIRAGVLSPPISIFCGAALPILFA